MLLPKAKKVEASGICAGGIEDIVSLYSKRGWSGFATLNLKEKTRRGALIFLMGELAGAIYEDPDGARCGGDALRAIDKLIATSSLTVYLSELRSIVDYLGLLPEVRLGRSRTSHGEAVASLINQTAVGLNRKKLLEKYGIKEPGEKEIEKLLKAYGFNLASKPTGGG
jgi:hypothetical protein